MAYKQVILVRYDLKLPKGKLAVQVAHASVEAVLKTSKQILDLWRFEGGKKIVLKVPNKFELLKFKDLAADANLKIALIKDAGKTTIKPGTLTCLGIGPDLDSKIDSLTKNLKMV